MAIEQFYSELESIIPSGQDIEELGRGYLIAEGPLWCADEGYLLFSDIRHDRRMKWTATESVTLFHQPTNEANGLTLDPQGRLLACEYASRRVNKDVP